MNKIPSLSENIRDITPVDFFQKSMVPIRAALLDGEALPRCGECSSNGTASQGQWSDKNNCSKLE
jgi:hypothetical protein